MVDLGGAGVWAEIGLALAGFVFLLVIWAALRNWVFELSPNEWLYTLIISFALGVFLAAYVDGDGLLLLLSIIPIFLAIVWWIGRLIHRHRVKTARAQAGGT
jgi:hypothetical protein